MSCSKNDYAPQWCARRSRREKINRGSCVVVTLKPQWRRETKEKRLRQANIDQFASWCATAGATRRQPRSAVPTVAFAAASYMLSKRRSNARSSNSRKTQGLAFAAIFARKLLSFKIPAIDIASSVGACSEIAAQPLAFKSRQMSTPLVVMTGVPHASASINTKPKFSWLVGSTNKSAD